MCNIKSAVTAVKRFNIYKYIDKYCIFKDVFVTDSVTALKKVVTGGIMKQTKCSKCLLMWDSLVVRKCNHEAVNRTYGKNICICCCQKCRYSEQFKTGWICTYKKEMKE